MKLSWDEVQLIRRASWAWADTQKQLAKKFNVSVSTIWRIINFKTWKI